MKLDTKTADTIKSMGLSKPVQKKAKESLISGDDIQDVISADKAKIAGLKTIGDIRYARAGNDKDKIEPVTLSHYNWLPPTSIPLKDANGDSLVPILELVEFQPSRGYQWAMQNTLGQDFGASMMAPSSNTGKALKSIAGMLSSKAGGPNITPTSIETGILKEWFEGGSMKGDSMTGQTIGGMDYIKSLMSGEFLGSYELPFFSTEFVTANSIAGWSGGGAEKAYSAGLSKVMTTHYGLNFPVAPSWTQSEQMGQEITFDITLFNDTDENWNRNYKFLRKFVAGQFWAQLGDMQQAPNLFYVHCPGRFKWHFAAIGTTVIYQGKLRNVTLDSGYQAIPGLDMDNRRMLVPETYKLTVTIKNMTPNNYNVFMDSIISPSASPDKTGHITQIMDFGTGNASSAVMGGKSVSNVLNKLDKDGAK